LLCRCTSLSRLTCTEVRGEPLHAITCNTFRQTVFKETVWQGSTTLRCTILYPLGFACSLACIGRKCIARGGITWPCTVTHVRSIHSGWLHAGWLLHDHVAPNPDQTDPLTHPLTSSPNAHTHSRGHHPPPPTDPLTHPLTSSPNAHTHSRGQSSHCRAHSGGVCGTAFLVCHPEISKGCSGQQNQPIHTRLHQLPRWDLAHLRSLQGSFVGRYLLTRVLVLWERVIYSVRSCGGVTRKC
jgi:hypothetical protein